jgi:hypothetical protein
MKFELDLATTQMKLGEYNKTAEKKVELRNAESKNFE